MWEREGDEDFEELYAPIRIEGEGMLHSTFRPDERSDAERVAQGKGAQVKPYGINIIELGTDPATKGKKAIKWEKVAGFSVWL